MNEKVAYICADRRSGSTLFCMILGRHKQLTGVGEIHSLYDFLNDKYIRDGKKEETCTCGEKLYDCEFWGPILNKFSEVHNENPAHFQTRFPQYKNKVKQYALEFYLSLFPLSFIHKSHPLSKQANEVAEVRKSYYKVINGLYSAEYVIDSSKRIDAAKMLLAANPETTKMIFLKRDIRAIAYSKHKRRKGSNLYVMAMQTFFYNLKFFFTIITTPKEKKLVVKYEDLVADPKSILNDVCNYLNVPFSPEAINLKSYEEAHNIGGSPSRHGNKSLELNADNKWRNELPPLKRMLLTSILFPVNLLLGYNI